MKGPDTAAEADADPLRRHVVRLTGVRFEVDPLYADDGDPAHRYPETPVVEITWGIEDALPFPLCLSARRPAPDCDLVTGISVARGNVILVDHGRRPDGPEDLGQVGTGTSAGECECEGSLVDVTVLPEPFIPKLKQGPLTFAEPLPERASAAALFRRDPRRAVPWISLVAVSPATAPLAAPEAPASPARAEERWTPRLDLLRSGSADAHFVVEIDDDGVAALRFGDGELGRMPEAGTTFSASYRVGNGTAGNVAADTILSAFWRGRTASGITLKARNPLPASGGADPEPAAEARLIAPRAFRKEMQRAVIAEDYALLAARGRENEIQGAGASLCWTGSWYEALVVIDPLGEETAEKRLLGKVQGGLHRFRRMGHDLAVRIATYVPLEVELTVCVLPHFLRAQVEAALRDLFSSGIRADGRNGFFHPDNLSFGEGIYLSRLVAEAQAVPGVENARVTRLRRLGEGDQGEIEAGVLSLGPLEIARLDSDPDFPENGVLTLKLGGGR